MANQTPVASPAKVPAGAVTDAATSSAPSEPVSAGPRRVQVIYGYAAQEEDELTLKEGDVIEVISSEGEWWLGKLGDCAGTFPYNYVQPTT